MITGESFLWPNNNELGDNHCFFESSDTGWLLKLKINNGFLKYATLIVLLEKWVAELVRCLQARGSNESPVVEWKQVLPLYLLGFTNSFTVLFLSYKSVFWVVDSLSG